MDHASAHLHPCNVAHVIETLELDISFRSDY